MAYSVNKNSTVQPVTTPSCLKCLLCLRAAVVFLFAINFLLCTEVCSQFIKFLCSRLRFSKCKLEEMNRSLWPPARKHKLKAKF